MHLFWGALITSGSSSWPSCRLVLARHCALLCWHHFQHPHTVDPSDPRNCSLLFVTWTSAQVTTWFPLPGYVTKSFPDQIFPCSVLSSIWYLPYSQWLGEEPGSTLYFRFQRRELWLAAKDCTVISCCYSPEPSSTFLASPIFGFASLS